MADITTTNTIGTPLSNGYGGYVRLDTGAVLGIAAFQKAYAAAEAGSKPVIASVVKSAYDTIVGVNDGRRISLGQFLYETQQAATPGDAPAITNLFQRGYEAIALGANGERQYMDTEYVK
ncbi:MAG: hypothetical protein AAFP08_08695 [Bacteroidota bacterium]